MQGNKKRTAEAAPSLLSRRRDKSGLRRYGLVLNIKLLTNALHLLAHRRLGQSRESANCHFDCSTELKA
jgi:hypothetical protein